MSSREIELVSPLLDEVVDWVESGQLFIKSPNVITESRYTFPDGTIPFEVTGVSEWNQHVDIHNEDSQYVELIELTNNVGSAFSLIHQFGPEEFSDYAWSRHEAVQKHVNQNPVVEKLGKILHESYSKLKGDTDWEESLDQLRSTIHSHFNGIILARAVSLSKRHAPMEALFLAYRQGLMPYGWDWESIYCLDPDELLA